LKLEREGERYAKRICRKEKSAGKEVSSWKVEKLGKKEEDRREKDGKGNHRGKRLPYLVEHQRLSNHLTEGGGISWGRLIVERA